jgi:LPS export ABC transporter protein LptC
VPWSLTATRASRTKSDAMLDLEGEVELRSVPADGARVFVLTTARLRFDPGRSWVESDQRVDLRVGGLALSGVGLGANLNDEKLQLKSEVHGEIAP